MKIIYFLILLGKMIMILIYFNLLLNFMKKGVVIVLVIVGVLALIIGGLVFAYFYFFVGITPKQKYEKCAENCEEIMLLESNIPACKVRCMQISGYDPSTETQTPQTDEEESENQARDYYCQWSWPQKIIDRDTKEVVYTCTYAKPYCNYADGSYENVGCCTDVVNDEHINCTKLSDLLK